MTTFSDAKRLVVQEISLMCHKKGRNPVRPFQEVALLQPRLRINPSWATEATS